MVTLPINGVTIDFPYTPYGPQIRYMSRVIDALRAGHNALLESPTGTGKTLCLLCAALAWRSSYVAALQARMAAGESDVAETLAQEAGLRAGQLGAADALGALVNPAVAPELRAPRIVFASRTHTQLAQAIGELKKTVYRPGMVVLGSRDVLCVHEAAKGMGGSRLSALCRRITAPNRRECRFHLPVASPRPHENRCEDLVDKMYAEPPMDIEDLKGFGRKEGACPWFLSRAAARGQHCDILFLPYNYLLDRSARDSLDIDWTNDIVIIDEAHNLESMCADAMSFDLTSFLRASCDAELATCIEQGARPGGISFPALEKLAQTEQGLDAVLGSENRDLLEFRVVRSVLKTAEEFINSVDFDCGNRSDIEYRVFPGAQFRTLFEQANGPTADTYELFIELLDRAMGSQAEDVDNTSAASRRNSSTTGNSPLRALQSAIRVLFESVGKGQENCFRTVVQNDKSKPNSGRTISYWCFDPSVGMADLRALGLRCMLLTSGTLSPMDSFSAELGTSFPVRLENPHVITTAQAWAGVMKVGPDTIAGPGGRLTSAYQARGEASDLELGRAMIRFSAIIPDGLLVFFPSYGAMHSCVEVWKDKGPGSDGAKPSVWEHLLRVKLIVAEERESSQFGAAILAHRTNVDSGYGSILLAVCRGKVSEGIDFSDEYGRAVVITGLPYPAATDPKVVLKRQFADERARAAKQQAQSCTGGAGEKMATVLTGGDWYAIQALRAVNQAVGRAIRHRNDYGVVLLCDERFQAGHLQEKVSKWLRPYITVCQQFRVGEDAVRRFFERASESDFAKRGKAAKMLRNQGGNSEGGGVADVRRASDNYRGDRQAVLAAQQAIARFLPEAKSEQKLVEQACALSDQVAAYAREQAKGVVAAETAPSCAFGEEPHLKRARLKVLNWSSESAAGGLTDATIPDATPAAQGPEDSAPTRSALFLAKRNRAASGKGPKIERMRREREPGTQAGPSFKDGGGGKEPFSKRIQSLFARKEDARRFLALFREILTAYKALNEGDGPLSADRDKHAGESGKIAVQQVVTLTRQNGSGAVAAKECFLADLRAKIPVGFQSWYDAALAQSR